MAENMVDQEKKRDHGGNLDQALKRYGGDRSDWLDLSTGINRRPWNCPPVPDRHWRDLPTTGEINQLAALARHYWQACGSVLPLAGAQAAIQLLPQVLGGKDIRILSPTYNEYAGVFDRQDRRVLAVDSLKGLRGADIAIVVNPNNPTGLIIDGDSLQDLVSHTGQLVVDESFGDTVPAISVAHDDRILVLKSFGKFHGLAGLRLGFAMGPAAIIDAMAKIAGPWQISGPALFAGLQALSDQRWADAMRDQLTSDRQRMDALADKAGLSRLGGTDLFRLYAVKNAAQSQAGLAAAKIWSRVFPWSKNWIRLGLPGPEHEWRQLSNALLGNAP